MNNEIGKENKYKNPLNQKLQKAFTILIEIVDEWKEEELEEYPEELPSFDEVVASVGAILFKEPEEKEIKDDEVICECGCKTFTAVEGKSRAPTVTLICTYCGNEETYGGGF